MTRSFDLHRLQRSFSFNSRSDDYFHSSIKPVKSDWEMPKFKRRGVRSERDRQTRQVREPHHVPTQAAPPLRTTCDTLTANTNPPYSAPVSPALSSPLSPIHLIPPPSSDYFDVAELDLDADTDEEEADELSDTEDTKGMFRRRFFSRDRSDPSHLSVPPPVLEDAESALSVTPHKYPMPLLGVDISRCNSLISLNSQFSDNPDLPCYHEPVFSVNYDNSAPLGDINPLSDVTSGSTHNLAQESHPVNIFSAPPPIRPLARTTSKLNTINPAKLPAKINNSKLIRKRKSRKNAVAETVVSSVSDSEAELERYETASNTACAPNIIHSQKPAEAMPKPRHSMSFPLMDLPKRSQSFTHKVVHKLTRPFRTD